MLCSVSSAGKSSSKWLNRLRLSKGFPSGDDLNLEEFLNHQNPNVTQPRTTTTDDFGLSQPVHSLETSNQSGDEKLFNVVSNVLAELFVMGSTSNIHAKKSSRKQQNPKLCTINSNRVENAGRRGERALSSKLDVNSRAGARELTDQVKEVEDKKELSCGEEEGKTELSLSGFSRTEVTVIDTSCVSWKFEKLLFRRKNVWKVRDKKSKTVNFGKKKKRKGDISGMGDDLIGKRKKHKVSNGICRKLKVANGVESKLPLQSEEAYHPNERLEQTSRRTLNDVCELPKMKHLNSKLTKGGSSVILIKSIPSSKKNGASTSRSCSKPVTGQHKA